MAVVRPLSSGPAPYEPGAPGAKCPNCQCSNMPAAEFCDQCGQELDGEERAPTPADVICPSCQQANRASAIYCKNCGETIPGGAHADATLEDAKPTSSSDRFPDGAVRRRNMTQYAPCANCGVSAALTDAFCGQCGDELNVAARADILMPDDVTCPACETRNRSTGVFCHGCGQSIPSSAFHAAESSRTGAVIESDTGPAARREYLDGLARSAERSELPTDNSIISRLGTAERVTAACQHSVEQARAELSSTRSMLAEVGPGSDDCRALLAGVRNALASVERAEADLDAAQRREQRLSHEFAQIERADLGLIGGPLGLGYE